MILYLMRHSAATKDNEDTDIDSDRPLTDEGMDKANEVACGLEHILDPIDLPRCIYTSPALRCYQTGEIVQKHWSHKPKLETLDDLGEYGDEDKLMEYLASISPEEPIMLITHKPVLKCLVRKLIGAGKDACISFKRCSVAKIDFDANILVGEGKLCWLYDPYIIEQFA